MQYQDENGDTVCCLGEQGEVVETADVAYNDAGAFSWQCCCGHTVDFEVKNVIDPSHRRIYKSRRYGR